jgi:hypothetical protein
VATVRIPVGMLRDLDRVAKARGMSRAALVAELLAEGFDRAEREEKPAEVEDSLFAGLEM